MKHLNPRQGITTLGGDSEVRRAARTGVKHLNPRQGITNVVHTLHPSIPAPPACETPKSPPGDYNHQPSRRRWKSLSKLACETPKSPPGDDNLGRIRNPFEREANVCETPKSPPGDDNRACASGGPAAHVVACETPKSPPGDYNAGRMAVVVRDAHLIIV